jgi:hypothetical protein
MIGFTRHTVVILALLIASPVRAQYTNIRVSDIGSTNPEEVTIAIDPTNPMRLVAGANIDYYYYSSDGGMTWQQGQLSSSLGVWGDPCVAFDADGNAYYAHLSWPLQVADDYLDRIVVQKSTNGGSIWSDGVGVGLNHPKDQDKEWLTADLTDSIYRNNLYLAWTEFDAIDSSDPADSTRILFSRSTDHGVNWSTPVRVSDLAGNALDGDDTVEGAVPAIGPNGEVYLCWAGRGVLFFDRSLDGGVTFGTDVVVAAQPGGWVFDVPGIYRCNGFPVTMCDVSNSPYRGHLYIVFSDQRNGTDDTDIFIVESTDGGTTWTSPLELVPETGPAQQFFPWGTVDPVTGHIYIVYYDRRFTAGNDTDVYMSYSQDGGATWDDFEVSAAPFTPTASVFFGDYINVAALGGKVYPIWMRMDGTDLSVWTALVDLPTGIAANIPKARGVELEQNYPNPFNPTTAIDFRLPATMHIDLSIFDVTGRRVATLADETLAAGPHRVVWDGAGVGSGVYFYRLHAGDETVTRKLTVLK